MPPALPTLNASSLKMNWFTLPAGSTTTLCFTREVFGSTTRIRRAKTLLPSFGSSSRWWSLLSPKTPSNHEMVNCSRSLPSPHRKATDAVRPSCWKQALTKATLSSGCTIHSALPSTMKLLAAGLS